MKKRILSLVMAVVMAISVIAVPQSGFVIETAAAGTAADIVRVAKGEVGYRSPSTNRHINPYGPTEAWCGHFVSWCAAQAGVPTSVIPKSGYVPTFQQWYADRGRWYTRGSITPQVGDLIIFSWSNTPAGSRDHIEIVSGVSSTHVTTIGGNTGDPVGVHERTWTLGNSQILGYCRPDYQPSDPLKDGNFISYNGNVYVIAGGTPLWVEDWAAIGGAKPVNTVTANQFNSLLTYPKEGTFLSGYRSGRVFRVGKGGHPYYISDWNLVGGIKPYITVTDIAINEPHKSPAGSRLNCSPNGRLDFVGSSDGRVTVRGWAWDGDKPSENIEIHVYIGGQLGNSNAERIIAGKTGVSRPDVNNAYPGIGNNHGYDFTLTTSKRGNQPVYVYAINLQGTAGGNSLIGSGTVNITNPPPTTTTVATTTTPTPTTTTIATTTMPNSTTTPITTTTKATTTTAATTTTPITTTTKSTTTTPATTTTPEPTTTTIATTTATTTTTAITTTTTAITTDTSQTTTATNANTTSATSATSESVTTSSNATTTAILESTTEPNDTTISPITTVHANRYCIECGAIVSGNFCWQCGNPVVTATPPSTTAAPAADYIVGRVIDIDTETSIFDALEILKYLVGMPSKATNNPAALITAESKQNGVITIFDALEILKKLVGMANEIDNP